MYLNILPKCPDLFSGREREIKKIEKIFTETNFVYIEGISGIGKTSLMLRWANILFQQDEYKDNILWLKYQKDWTFDIFLMKINDWLISRGGETNKDYLNLETIESEEKCLYIISCLNKNKYILFIDDFQYMKYEYSNIFLDKIKNYMRNSHIYVISNEALPLAPIENIDMLRLRVNGLLSEDSLLLLEKIFTFHEACNIPDRENLMKIAEKSKGYPLFLKTFSKLILSRLYTVEEIIKDSIIEKDIGKSIFEKVINNLTDGEKSVLEILSASRISLSLETIEKISPIEDFLPNIQLLEKKIFIEKDNLCLYLIQPVLKEFIWNNISENRKKIAHKILAEYFEKETEFFNEVFYHLINGGEFYKACKIFEKNIMKHLFSLGYYEEFIEKLELLGKYIPLTEEMKIMKADILSVQRNWRESLVILEEIKNNSNDKNLLAETYLSIANIYANTGNIQDAIKFYEDSLSMFRETGNSERTIKVINSLARIYGFLRQFDRAADFVEESFSIAEKENNEMGKAYSLRVKVVILIAQEEFDKAFEVSEECLKLAIKIGSFWLISRSLGDKCIILMRMCRDDEAFKCFEKLLALGKEAGDRVVIAFSYLNFGMFFYQKGDMEHAVEFCNKSIEEYKAVGNEIGVANGEYNLALVFEEKKEIHKAIDLYSTVIEKARKYSFRELEIRTELRLIKSRLLTITPEELFSIKARIPENYVRGLIQFNLLLSFVYFRENKHREKEKALKEALKLSEKSFHTYGFTMTYYIMSRISSRDRKEKEFFKKKAEEKFEKLMAGEKRDLNCVLDEIDNVIKKKICVKIGNKEYIDDFSSVEKLRKRRKDFEIFIDIPNKAIWERNMEEIDIFKKRKLLSLLLFLIRNAGNCFSTEEIYKEIWGWGYKGDVSDTEVRKNISRLRDLIEPSKKSLKYILLRESFLTEKGKYYFNDKVKFCVVGNVN